MALQNFVDQSGPTINASWLNVVDQQKFTVFADAVTKATVRTALTSDAALEITNGGTGARTLGVANGVMFNSAGVLTSAAGLTFDGAVLTTLGGSFTTLAASSTVSGTGFSTYLASPPAIGGSVAAAGAFTTATANAFIPNSSTVPANGLYLPSANAIGFATNTVARGSISSAGAWSVTAPTAGVALTVHGVAGTHSTQIADSAATLYDAGYLGLPPSSNVSGTLVLADRGKSLSVAAGQTIPNAVFAAGDVVVVYNNSAAPIVLTAGIATLRLAGTATTGNRTIAQRGWATIYFVSGTEGSVGGAGVT